jgi:hypothetical protein
MAQIRFNVGNDLLTGKKIKYTSLDITLKNGFPTNFTGLLTYHEVNDDPAVTIGSTERQKKATSSTYENYQVSGKFIDSTSKLYVSQFDGNGVPTVGAISLESYFENKAINTFSSVAGGNPLSTLVEGLCKEMIDIRKLNGEF